MDDYLAAEPLIIARLKDQISNVTIQSTWGMPKIQENPDLHPSVQVFLEEDRPGQESGYSQKVEQVWLCLVAVADAQKEAGPLISQVIKAMSGWRPNDVRFSVFRRVKSGFAPDVSVIGTYYFPLAFSTSFIFNIQ